MRDLHIFSTILDASKHFFFEFRIALLAFFYDATQVRIVRYVALDEQPDISWIWNQYGKLRISATILNLFADERSRAGREYDVDVGRKLFYGLKHFHQGCLRDGRPTAVKGINDHINPTKDSNLSVEKVAVLVGCGRGFMTEGLILVMLRCKPFSNLLPLALLILYKLLKQNSQNLGKCRFDRLIVFEVEENAGVVVILINQSL